MFLVPSNAYFSFSEFGFFSSQVGTEFASEGGLSREMNILLGFP